MVGQAYPLPNTKELTALSQATIPDDDISRLKCLGQRLGV